ncbi:MAG: THUMP domain-containing protein [Thaumarchaeota archaeon]|nr:THUMP domain-containing protein [Nitrososphaerota archaeon]
MISWNCIVTCPRHMEEDAMAEAEELLGTMGDESPGAEPTGISGIVVVRTGLDPVAFSRRVRQAVAEAPWSVRYIRRIIPVHAAGRSDVQSVLNMVEGLSSRIGPGDTYRVSLEKRNTQASGREIIESIAATIPNRVSLEDPDVVVQVEILGGVAGISVLRPGDIFSLETAKREMSDC